MNQSRHAWRGVADEEFDEATVARLRGPSRRLLGSLLRPYRWWLVFLVLVVVLEAAARLSIPVLVRRVLDSGIGVADVLLTSVLGMLAAIVVQTIARVLFVRRSGRIANHILLELRRRLYAKFQRLSISFHERYTSGRAISRITSDVEAVQELVLQGLDVLVAAVLTICGVTVMMLLLDWRLALCALLSYPLLWWLMRWFARAATRAFRRVRAQSALVIVQFIETMTGIKAVQAFRREPRAMAQFSEVTYSHRDAGVQALRVFARALPAIQFTGSLGIAFVVLGGGYLVLQGHTSVGTMAAFVLYLRMLFDPMQHLGQFISSLQSAFTALEKISSVLDETDQLPEPSQPVALPTAQGHISFDQVRFGYVDAVNVLPGLSVEIPAGQSVALVGTTGAGKTTVAKLLARFYDPQHGAVRLDGVKLGDLSEATLRRHITLLTQENFIFAGTIADNIAFGNPQAPREEVIAAARAVGAAQFIEALPQGYDTDTGKRGSRLSAGQRQLVAFARVLLANPAVVILDEATSSLDIPSERLVQAAMQRVLAHRTAIIIAHRLSTVEIADRVLVLQGGKIVEDGPPAALIAGGGRYADLHAAWLASLA